MKSEIFHTRPKELNNYINSGTNVNKYLGGNILKKKMNILIHLQ